MSEYIITDEQLNRFFHCPTAECDEIKANLLEVIRCRDCKHRECDEPRADGTCPCVILAHGNEATLWVRPDDYCAWAEPKEEA